MTKETNKGDAQVFLVIVIIFVTTYFFIKFMASYDKPIPDAALSGDVNTNTTFLPPVKRGD